MTELPQPPVPIGTTAHSLWVKIAHWIVTASFLTLAFSGFVILMCHPRLYWGEVGNDLTPALRFVTFYSYDDCVDSIDLLDARHPQTLLAYGMNGQDLSVPHGAPVRLRVETQLGYRSMKYLQRIVVRAEFDDGGEKGTIRNGWSWYAGI